MVVTEPTLPPFSGEPLLSRLSRESPELRVLYVLHGGEDAEGLPIPGAVVTRPFARLQIVLLVREILDARLPPAHEHRQ